MPFIDIIGYVAGFLILISLVPQIVKSWRSKSTKDLSLARYLIYTAGIALWLTYGVAINNLPMMITNSVALILACSILYLKFKYG